MDAPATHSQLVLYDDAQSIYVRGRSKNFSFKSVGIQAQGRTTILKINYRNTRQILELAHLMEGRRARTKRCEARRRQHPLTATLQLQWKRHRAHRH